MTWNYRIIHQKLANDDWYAVHEVYYDKTGRITDWTACAVAPSGQSEAELRESLTRYQDAWTRPVLEWADLIAVSERPSQAEQLELYKIDHATERLKATTAEAWAELLSKREKEIYELRTRLEDTR